MALNPIAFTEKVVRSFLRYQLTAYPFADEGLHGQMRRLLSLDETRKSPLLKGPYISLSRPFRQGASVAELVREGVFHPHMRQRIPSEIHHVYGHQEEAIRAIRSGRTTLISTGTGSGKTECFLYPIVSRCLELRDQGVAAGISAVIVYPMNALAEDQLIRLRSLLAGTGIPFGMYVGKTPERESEVTGKRLPPGSSRADYEAQLAQFRREKRSETVYPPEEVCSREIMRTAGRQPRILLTNVKQLELLLTRQHKDNPGVLRSCLSCGAIGRRIGSTYREPARPVRATNVADVHVLAQDMVHHSERPRLLVFCDNRQDAAFQAGWMKDHARRFRLRAMMAEGLKGGALSVGDLGRYVDDVLEKDESLSRALVPEVWQVVRKEGGGGRHEQERRKFLRIQVLREVTVSSRQPIGLEPWGRMKVEYEGLDADRLRLQQNHGVWRCKSCRRLTTRRTPGHACPAWRCSGELEFMREDPDNYNLQLLDQRYSMLRPEEHTAMVPHDERERLENLFKGESEAVNAFVCTPTLELGVDIGMLDAVLMRNVPPLPANYWQRAGRAGRRHRMAVDLTYCRPVSHDRSYFADPLKLLAGRVDPPAFNLKNDLMVAKHVHATVITRLHQYMRDPSRSKIERDRIEAVLRTCLPDRVSAYLFEDGLVRERAFDLSPLKGLIDANVEGLTKYVENAFRQGWPLADAEVTRPEGLRSHVTDYGTGPG